VKCVIFCLRYGKLETKRTCGRKFLHQVLRHSFAKLCMKNYENPPIKVTGENQWHLFMWSRCIFNINFKKSAAMPGLHALIITLIFETNWGAMPGNPIYHTPSRPAFWSYVSPVRESVVKRTMHCSKRCLSTTFLIDFMRSIGDHETWRRAYNGLGFTSKPQITAA